MVSEEPELFLWKETDFKYDIVEHEANSVGMQGFQGRYFMKLEACKIL